MTSNDDFPSGTNSDDVPAALRRYEDLRIARATDVQCRSRDRGTEFHLPDGPVQRARGAALPALVEADADLLFDHDLMPDRGEAADPIAG